MSFQPIDTMLDFLEPVNKYVLSDDQGYKPNQLGFNIEAFEERFPSLENTDIVLIGCGENRGAGSLRLNAKAPDAVRKELYSLYHWHKDIRVASGAFAFNRNEPEPRFSPQPIKTISVFSSDGNRSSKASIL